MTTTYNLYDSTLYHLAVTGINRILAGENDIAGGTSELAAMTRTLKYTINETRPDGGRHSFPSGHTANAFLGAHIAWKEFKDSSPVLAYSGYALALFVAGSRLYNNRHWVADVVAGAGFGILSVELAYLCYFPVRNAIACAVNKRAADRLILAPTFSPDGSGGGFYLAWRF